MWHDPLCNGQSEHTERSPSWGGPNPHPSPDPNEASPQLNLYSHCNIIVLTHYGEAHEHPHVGVDFERILAALADALN